GLCFLGQTSQRSDERFDVVGCGSAVGADFDKGRVERLRGLEKFGPVSTPRSVGSFPPPGAQFDFHVSQSGVCDLFGKPLVADCLAYGPQIIEDEPESRPSGGRDLSHPVKGIEGAAFARSEWGGVPGARPTCGYQLWAAHCPSRSFLHSRNR